MNSTGSSTNVGIGRPFGKMVGDQKKRVGVDEASSDPVDGYWSSMAIKVVTGAPSSISVYAAADINDVHTPHNVTSQPQGGATQPVRMTGIPSGEWIEVPPSCFPCISLKFVGDSAGEIEIMYRN